MTQLLMPIFPPDTTDISRSLCFKKNNGQITYFLSAMPIFTHAESDVRSFRMITSQFYVNGLATQAEIIRAFGVSKNSVIRAVKRYQLSGPEGFYAPRKTRGSAVLTPPVLEDVQVRLDKGDELSIIAQTLGLKKNTLEKAVRADRLHIVKKNF